jgi:hypothetical protein
MREIPKTLQIRFFLPVTAILLAGVLFIGGCSRQNQSPAGVPARGGAQGSLAEPAGSDLVVFVAEFKSTSYRLAGRRPLPWSNARFYSPISIIADSRRQCFFVLDQPMHIDEPFKIWRLDINGQATVIYTSPTGPDAPGHSWIQSLGQDADGRLILADAGTGLWRLEANGQLQQLIASREPLSHITAANLGPGGNLFVASAYQDQVISRDILVNTLHSQGGLFRFNPESAAGPERLITNQRPGAPQYDTHWRQVRQILCDTAGRLLLVDAGTKEIKGGVLVFHPQGQLEDLTFKTPQQNSGPLGHPRGIAQWASDSYIVADPGMVVEGMNGTGGLLVLHLDGKREALWPFGYRIRPCGVAVLRGVNAAPAPPALQLNPAAIAGTYGGGEMRIGSLKWERQKTTSRAPGDLLYGLDVIPGMMSPLDDREAQERLRSIFEHARWIITPDGLLRLEASTGEIAGKLVSNTDYALGSAAYVKQGPFDMKTYSVDAMLFCIQSGQLQASISFTYMDKKDRVTGEFEQVLVKR